MNAFLFIYKYYGCFMAYPRVLPEFPEASSKVTHSPLLPSCINNGNSKKSHFKSKVGAFPLLMEGRKRRRRGTGGFLPIISYNTSLLYETNIEQLRYWK